MSEKGSIAYAYDRPLDESCYREAEGADLFVMLIGRRYGSQSSVSDRVATAAFYERYDSITKGEYEHARLSATFRSMLRSTRVCCRNSTCFD